MTTVIDAPGRTTAPRPAEPAVAAPPRVRAAVGIIVTQFPRLDEPFILREIDELERQGQPVVLVPLHRAGARTVHEEAKPWLRRALYTPPISLAIVLANLRMLIRQPRRYLGTLLEIILGMASAPLTLLRALAVFPKTVYLAGVLRRHGVRHVHAHFATAPATAAWVMSRVGGLSYSFTVHGPDIFVHRFLIREKIANAEFVRAVSTFVKAFLCGLYPIVTEGKIDVVHAGVNPDVYALAAATTPAIRKRPRILSVARLTESKAFPVLVDALGRLKKSGVEFDCVIAGEGDQRREIENALRQHDVEDCVRLVGAVPQHEVARLIGEADIFVLPSVIAYSGQMDGIPVALMEAMAAGRPVVAAAISGIPELVDNGRNGILADMTHPDRIARAIGMLLEDSELRDRLGAAAKEKVRKRFDVRDTAAKMIPLLEREPMVKTAAAAKSITSLNWELLNVCTLGIERVQERADSVIAEVAISDGIRTRKVVAKQHRTPATEDRTPAEMARFEHDTLVELHKRLGTLSFDETSNVRFTVPRPLLVDERHGALVMERAQGMPLERLVRRARNRGLAHLRLKLPLRRAGRWLRLMQTVTRSGDDGRHIVTAVVVIALRDLELAVASDPFIRANAEAIEERLRTLESIVATRHLPMVGHHGDYWSGNIFVGERLVSVIDFEGFREGVELEDVAYFLVHLEQYFGYPMMERFMAPMRDAFLSGYADGDALDEDALALFTIAKGLQLLARGGGAESRPFANYWKTRALRRAIFRGLA